MYILLRKERDLASVVAATCECAAGGVYCACMCLLQMSDPRLRYLLVDCPPAHLHIQYTVFSKLAK